MRQCYTGRVIYMYTCTLNIKINYVLFTNFQWQAFTATQPDQDKSLNSDIASIDHAMRTIGDYKLKQSDEFKLSDQFKNTSLYKLSQLVEARREVCCKYIL